MQHQSRPSRAEADIIARVGEAVAHALQTAGREPLVLAISGGRDSMVMLDAIAHIARERVACVATFDHGTGAAAVRAIALVEHRARELGLPVRTGRASAVASREAAWRELRWRFLREVAAKEGGVVATAHTRDDQVETVLMRVLRGAGARGVAGLYARGDVVRPLLELSRSDVAAYAIAARLTWVDDPSNVSRRHLRNRVRLDLIPALERARPGISDELLSAARRAAVLRDDIDRFIDRAVAPSIDGQVLAVARTDLAGYDAQGLGVLWPAIVARMGIALDRRGTDRLTQFTIRREQGGGRIQLSGGYEAVYARGGEGSEGAILVRRARRRGGRTGAGVPLSGTGSIDGEVVFDDGWRFRRVEGGRVDGDRLWTAELPADRTLWVREWRPGDRMTPHGATQPRRVKGLLRDAGIDAARRGGWPVVLAGDEIVWIPGVRRASAATVRSGRPLALYRCEHDGT